MTGHPWPSWNKTYICTYSTFIVIHYTKQSLTYSTTELANYCIVRVSYMYDPVQYNVRTITFNILTDFKHITYKKKHMYSALPPKQHSSKCQSLCVFFK